MPYTDKTLVLSVKDVTKSFGAHKAVDSISLDVYSGEIFGFLGPNGAGKSTTIRLILDILRADQGSITILGRSNRQTKGTHKDIGFLSGEMVLDNDLTGRQYLRLVNNLHGGSHETSIDQLAKTLEADLDKKIGAYSRGNRQKIGLIGALLHRPKLLILDEPTSGFDPLVQEKFAELMREYVAEGGAVFMSSHILAEVQHLCDRLAFIKDGKIVTATSVHELLDTATKRITITAEPKIVKEILKDYQAIKGLSLIETYESAMSFTYFGEVQPALTYFASKSLTDITIREPELEEIFSRYYDKEEAHDA